MTDINIENVALYEDRFKGRKLIIPVFVPHMGCPHDCCFCNQRKISGQSVAPTYESVIKLIESYSGIVENYGSVEVAFYGGSFTAIPWHEQEPLLKAARNACEKFGFNPDFRVSTRPDYIDLLALERLKLYGIRTIELGVQSMCDNVLKLSGRGHLAEDTVKAAGLIKEHGFSLGIQTMPGLPGATYKDEITTALRVIELKPDIVRIYPTIVIRGTDLEKMYFSKEYEAMSLETAVEICSELIPMYENAGIRVIRVGLQSSDNISTDGEVVAGPYHPAFGEMVKSRIAFKFIMKILGNMKSSGIRLHNAEFMGKTVHFSLYEDNIDITVPAKMLSQFIGQKKINIKNIKEKFSGAVVKIKSV
ncbi:MAG: radical SAM protein [Ruminococcaceae bacterium]|nr:radical SAM protein [Oscillospiraceae bacterium]